MFVFAGDSARWDLLSDHQAAHGQQERVSLLHLTLLLKVPTTQLTIQYNSTLKDKWGNDLDNEFI